jgi:hypothetical protein
MDQPEQPRGRGRPPTGKKRVILKLDPEIDRQLAELAALDKISKSEFVERAVQRSWRSRGR